MKITRLFSIILTLGMILSFISPSTGVVDAAPAAQTAELPVLQITKTADAAQVNAGQPIGFTMTVSNTGLGVATGAQLIDLLPAGTTWSFDNPDCFITAEGWLVCEFGDLAAGAVETIHITATSTQAMCGVVTNRAAAEANNHAKVVSTTATVTVSCLTPGLILTKTADDEQVVAGQPIGFTLTVLNNGAGLAEDVTLTDQLYADLGWTVNNEACQIDETTSLMTCQFGDLAAGASASVHVSATSTADMCGLYENSASVSATNLTGLVTDVATIEILCVPDLRVQKTAESEIVLPGDTIRFSLLVESMGTGVIENAVLTDQLPAGAGLSWTIESVTGAGSCAITAGLLTCSFENMPAGETRTVVVASPTTSASCGVIDNSATVTATNEGQTEGENNTDGASITVNCTSLAIVKTADSEQIEGGDPLGFTITVSNGGESTALGVTVQDQLSTLTTWSDNSAACSISPSGLLTCNFGDLAAGASASVRVTAVSSAEICGLLENTATATATNLPGPISDSATVNIVCDPQITVRKIAEDDNIPAGQTARFNIVVSNQGLGAAENVVISDPLPVVAGVSWTFDNVVGGGTCEITTGVLSCNFGTLDPGESASVRISSATDASSCGYLINSVTAAASNDPDGASDIAQILVVCGADVTVTKTAERSPIRAADPTQPARFTLTVLSKGAQTATGVTLTDVLPIQAGLAWTIESVVGGGTCNLANNQILCNFGDMAPGATRSVVISSQTTEMDFCQVTSDRSIGNFVFVQATNEVAPANYDNSAYAEIMVECSPPIDDPECPPVTFLDDFSSGTPTSGIWTNYRTTVSPNRTEEFLGQYGNEEVTFTAENPNPDQCPMNMVRINFDLYIIRSWDGNVVRVYPDDPPVGPDYWRFGLQDVDRLINAWHVNTTFSNFDDSIFSFFTQAHPLPYPWGTFPPKTGVSASNTLGYLFAGPRDATYKMSFLIPITDQTVRLIWMGEHLQILEDESWGIDNLEVTMLQYPVFYSPNHVFVPLYKLLVPASSPQAEPERKLP